VNLKGFYSVLQKTSFPDLILQLRHKVLGKRLSPARVYDSITWVREARIVLRCNLEKGQEFVDL